MKQYTAPKMEVKSFAKEAILTASGEQPAVTGADGKVINALTNGQISSLGAIFKGSID